MFNTNSIQSFKRHFAPITTGTPGVSPVQANALKAISENFIAVGTILAEGGVSPDVLEMVGNQLLGAKLACESAVITGWAGGKTSNAAY